MNKISDPVGRRALVAGLGLGAAAAGAAGLANAAEAPAQGGLWRPTLEPQDDWLEAPSRHRMAFDASSADGAGEAADYADAFLYANKLGYGLEAKDLAVVIILRHFATPFAYGDAVWAKYGDQIGKLLKYDDPKTKKPPTRNLVLTTDDKDPEAQSSTYAGLAARGVRFAVCGLATHRLAEKFGGDDKAKGEAIHQEFLAGLIPGARIVPAGIVAVNRTQERGYAIAHMG